MMKYMSVADRAVVMIAWFLGSCLMTFISIAMNNAWWVIGMTAIYYVCFVVSLVLFLNRLFNIGVSNVYKDR